MVPTDWLDGHFVSGDVALDLANTVYRRRPEIGADLLTDADALARWFVRAGVLPDGSPGGSGRAALRDARALRALLWEVFDAQVEGDSVPEGALAAVLGAAARGGAGAVVRPDGTVVAGDHRAALAAVALSAVRLLLAPPRQGVRACDRCGWFFIDSSRGRRRRWCSMATCGNQTKAARHRATRP